MATKPKNIDGYVLAFPENIQERLQQKGPPFKKMFQKLNGRALVHFAGFNKHIGYALPKGA